MDISFIGWIHTLIAILAISSGAYSLKKHTIIETKNFSAKVFVVATIIAAVTALLIYKRGFGVGHLLAIVTLLAVIFGYVNEKGLFDQWRPRRQRAYRCLARPRFAQIHAHES